MTTLEDVLLEDTPVTREQLADALSTRSKDGGSLGAILVKMRAVGEEELARALARHLGLPFAGELRVEDVDADLTNGIPINFVKQHALMPLRREEGAVLCAVADPMNVSALDDLRTMLGLPTTPVVAAPERIVELINKIYAKKTESVELHKGDDEEGMETAEELIDILDLTDEAPIIRWVNSLMFQAVKERASDIHIEPGEKDVRVRYRIDGILYDSKRANKQYLASIISRVKIMAGLDIAEKRLPQDGRIRRRIAGRDIDMRVATAPAADGERVTIRLLDRTAVLLDLTDLGFNADHLRVMSDLITRPHGILLVTGPTGSGKTTTLYAALTQINKPALNILTVEDPIEYRLEGISQVQVNPKIDLTFASGLRSFLRHDPDVIMVGEIRDVETAEIAIQASLTGHLVLSTVHTNDAAGAITRLVDMGVQPFLVASSLLALLAQRLVRVVCPDCREPYRPTPEELRQLGISPDAVTTSVFRARGCKKCLDTGYRGRSGIYELLPVDEEIRALTLKNADSNAIRKAAVERGMRTLRDDGAEKVLAGITTIEEVMRVTQQDVE